MELYKILEKGAIVINGKAENEFHEILECPVTEERKIPMVFYFESKREDIEKVMSQHHAKWIVKALKEYSMPLREILYEKILQKIRDREGNDSK